VPEIPSRRRPTDVGSGDAAIREGGRADPGRRSFVIAIDGPAASGKSSTAQAVADRLGFAHLDSGALYRGVTLLAQQECGAVVGAPLDALAILRAADLRGLALHYDGRGFGVYLGGEPIDQLIRTPEVTVMVSAISALPEIRTWINQRLRSLARAGQSVVVDGRDIGTVVFPDADLKVFLNASPGVRASRRLAQRGEATDHRRLQLETEALAARDAADAGRAVAPLRMAPDAVPLDGTDLTFPQQVDRIVELFRTKAAPPPAG
jgi:cytidylate kinase